MDAFPLPVEGIKTRVNAHEQASEYMAMYSDNTRHGNRKENGEHEAERFHALADWAKVVDEPLPPIPPPRKKRRRKKMAW